MIIGLDPGTDRSAYVCYDAIGRRIEAHGLLLNDPLLMALGNMGPCQLVIEQFENYGMAVGRDVFATVWWSGRFFQAWDGPAAQLPRKTVKLHICGSTRATDANVRQALIDRFGRSKAEAIGTKTHKGPLYGLKSHEYAALAVAMTWAETHPVGVPVGPLVYPATRGIS